MSEQRRTYGGGGDDAAGKSADAQGCPRCGLGRPVAAEHVVPPYGVTPGGPGAVSAAATAAAAACSARSSARPVAPRRHYVPASRRIVVAYGRVVDLWELRPEDVDPRALAQHAAQKARFGGACRPAYSIAAHMVQVANRVIALGGDSLAAAYGVLHDAGECWLSDLVQPVKVQPGFEAFALLEERILRVVHTRFGLAPEADPVRAAYVREADRIETLREARWLLPEAVHAEFGDLREVEVLGPPPALSMGDAETSWLSALRALVGPAAGPLGVA